MSDLRVLAFGAFDRGPGYPRADGLLLGLQARGADVAECRIATPYAGTAKQRLARSPWLWPGFWLSMRRARRDAHKALRSAIETLCPDVILVPYPGHLVVRWVREVWDGPLVLDLFLSAYDTIVLDRELCRPDSLPAALLRRIDRQACAAADRILVDTRANLEFVAGLTRIPASRFVPVPVTDPEEDVTAPAYVPPRAGEPLELLFFGTGVPLHGLSHLLAAVASTDGVRLTLIGGAPADRQRAARMPPEKIRMLDEFVDSGELRRQLAATHLVAGVFGTTPKADRVVPFKVMHALQMGRPVITGRTRAACAEIRDGREAILVPPGDAPALADALRRLVRQPQELAAMAASARRLYERRFALAVVGEIMIDAMGMGAPPRPRRVDTAGAAPDVDKGISAGAEKVMEGAQ